MMRDLHECKAEVFRRLEEKKRKQRRNRRRFATGCACLCLCVTFVGVGLSLSSAPGDGPVSPVSEVEESMQSVEQSRPMGTTPMVITTDKPDTFGPTEGDTIPKKSEIYISPALHKLMQQGYQTEVVFRVIVEILTTYEDYEEAREYLKTIEELNALHETLMESCDAYAEAKEAFDQNKDESKRTELLAELQEKESYMRACGDQWGALYAEKERAYLDSVLDARLEYIYTVGATNVRPFEGSSDFVDGGWLMELSEDMIDDMAARGGYSFRMAPPERIEGYDVRIADHLTALLEEAAGDEMFHIAVITTADRYSAFASYRYLSVNWEYNADLFRSWQPRPYGSDGLSWEECLDMLVHYVDDIVERNGLTDRRIFNDKSPDVQIGEFDTLIYAGFEANATKAEILSLAEDPDIKLICSASFSDGLSAFGEAD